MPLHDPHGTKEMTIKARTPLPMRCGKNSVERDIYKLRYSQAIIKSPVDD